jgi:hypothetical protein
MVKNSFISRASRRTGLGSWDEEVTAIFHAQKGCIRLFVRGHTAVAHWRRPRALSIAFDVTAVF